jgi:alpha-amylase
MSSAQKKAICLYFEVHQPFRLKRYRFFDLGNDHYYYDDFTNESVLKKVAEKCYLPANKIIMDLITRHKGKFKVAFSLSGIVINQFRLYAPEVLDSFRELAQTGMVEFLGETEGHSLSSLKDKDEFTRQVNVHKKLLKDFLGVEPTSFRNTELIYSDQIGSWVADMGFKSILTEGAKHVLGWKSPNYLYCNAINPRLKVLLRNFVLSDDIAFRFSNRSWNEWPLTTDKYSSWLNKLAPKSELINIFIDYETFGEHHWRETGIFDFLTHLPGSVLKKTPFKFMTPSEVADNLQPISAISVPSPISWADEERDITAWLGNELQNAAFEKLYSLSQKVNTCNYDMLKKDWTYLQSSDHFYYMCTKFFSDGAVHAYFNPYETPYDAFMNYMNILSDFEIRINRMCPASEEQIKILKLDSLIKEKDELIANQNTELESLKKKLSKEKPKPKTRTTALSATREKTKETKKSVTEITRSKTAPPKKIKPAEKSKTAETSKAVKTVKRKATAKAGKVSTRKKSVK